MADVITRLKVESTEYDSKIKRASQGLLQMEQACRKVGGTLAILEKDELEFVKGLGKMETVSKDARGQLNELTKAFTDLSLQYKRLTDEEKQGDFGKALASSLGELKTRIQDTKKDLADIGQELSGSKFGQFGSIIDGIGHKMGVSANLTELLTSKTALMTAGIGAAVAAIYKGTEAWTKYNAELSKQDQITQVTTGLKGSGADHMTDVMRALSDTYKVDFREAINAANTLMTQFGKSGDEAIQLIKDGMQGMIQGDGGKLLNMIQQFAPAFRDAGISADKLVAIIHNSEGGLFSDQNMNAILMGIKNIRLMTKATSDSLAKLGIDGQEMSRKMSDGSLSVFEALKQVATKLKDCEAGSQEAGQVMQNVFGRQGAMQGMKLARAIAELNTNLEETKKQTGELGDAFAELQTANEKLNTAIRDAFSYDGWEQMANGIKATLISTLADVIEKLGKIRDFVAPGGITTGRYQNKRVDSEVKDVQSATQGEGDSAKIKQQQILDKYDREIAAKRKELERARTETNDGVGAPYATTIRVSEKTKEDIEKEIKALQKMKEEFRQESNKVITTPSPVNTEPEKPTPDPNKPRSIVKSTTSATAQELSPLQQAQKEISALTEEALTADEGRLEVIRQEIAALQYQVDVYKQIQEYAQGRRGKWNIQVGDRKAFEAEQKKIFESNVGTNANVFNEKNISSFIANLKKEISQAELGSELYNNLTAQIADANALANIMQTAIKNGIDVTQFNPQDLWSKVFGKNPGDYITDAQLEEIRKKIEEAIGKPINLNAITGDVSVGETETSDNLKELTGKISTVTSGLSSVASGLQQMGIELPQSVKDVMGFVSGLMSVINGVTSIIEVFNTSTSAAQIASQTANTAALSALTAAVAANTGVVMTNSAVSIIPGFANGGIAHAANGLLVPGHDYSDSTPVMVSSGELILNKAQQNTIASLLQESNAASVSSTPYVSGEQIYLGLTNYLIRSGRGELLTARG